MFKKLVLFQHAYKNLLKRFFYRDHKMHINGFTVNTIQRGNGDKTLLMLPGTMGTAWSDFRPQIESLPELLPNHKIIAWDPPGYGKSIPPLRDISLNCFQNEAKIAVNTMRALLRRKFSVMGWSAGVFTAIIMAGRFPEYVDKLILWGAGTYISEKDIQSIQELGNVDNWSETMRETFEEIYGKKGFLKLLPKSIECLSNFYNLRCGDVCSEEAKSVTAPTFLLRGNKDPLCSADHVPHLLETLPCYRYHEFPNGKHNIHLRYANEFNKMVVEFLLQNENSLKRVTNDKLFIQNTSENQNEIQSNVII